MGAGSAMSEGGGSFSGAVVTGGVGVVVTWVVGFDWALFLAKIAWTAALVTSLTPTSIASAFCGAAIFSLGASSIEDMLSEGTILTFC